MIVINKFNYRLLVCDTSKKCHSKIELINIKIGLSINMCPYMIMYTFYIYKTLLPMIEIISIVNLAHIPRPKFWIAPTPPPPRTHARTHAHTPTHTYALFTCTLWSLTFVCKKNILEFISFFLFRWWTQMISLLIEKWYTCHTQDIDLIRTSVHKPLLLAS